MVTHGKPGTIGDARDRLTRAAEAAGVEVVPADGDLPDVAIVLGGDGTMLRALRTYLGTGVSVFGVNFGRVGFRRARRGTSSSRRSRACSPATSASPS